MKQMQLMIDDLRPIRQIVLSNGDCYAVGGIGATSISPYYENDRQWFAIVKDGVIANRINADFVVTVWYG